MTDYIVAFLGWGIAAGMVAGFFCFFWGYAIKKLFQWAAL